MANETSRLESLYCTIYCLSKEAWSWIRTGALNFALPQGFSLWDLCLPLQSTDVNSSLDNRNLSSKGMFSSGGKVYKVYKVYKVISCASLWLASWKPSQLFRALNLQSRGIGHLMHAGGMLVDSLLPQQSLHSVRTVFAPKVWCIPMLWPAVLSLGWSQTWESSVWKYLAVIVIS